MIRYRTDLTELQDWDYQEIWAKSTTSRRNRGATFQADLLCYISSFHGPKEWGLLKRVNRNWCDVLSSPLRLRSLSSAVITRFHIREEQLSLNLTEGQPCELRFARRHYSEAESDWILLFNPFKKSEYVTWSPTQQGALKHSFSHRDSLPGFQVSTARYSKVVQCGRSLAILLNILSEDGDDEEEDEDDAFALLQLHEPTGHEKEKKDPTSFYLYSKLFTFPISVSTSYIFSMAFCGSQVFLYHLLGARRVLSRWSPATWSQPWILDFLDSDRPSDLSKLDQKHHVLPENAGDLRFYLPNDSIETGDILFASETRILLCDKKNGSSLLFSRVFRNGTWDERYDYRERVTCFSVSVSPVEEHRIVASKHIIAVLGSRWKFYTYQGSCVLEIDDPLAANGRELPMDITLGDECEGGHAILYVLHDNHKISVFDLEYKVK